MLYKLAFNSKCIVKHLEEICFLHSNFLMSLYHMPMTEEQLPRGDFTLSELKLVLITSKKAGLTTK
jgi:hypothetical protein